MTWGEYDWSEPPERVPGRNPRPASFDLPLTPEYRVTMDRDPPGTALDQQDEGASPLGVAITATPLLLVVAHLIWPQLLLLKLAAIGVVVLVSCLLFGALRQAIASRTVRGTTEFTPHVGNLLVAVIVGVGLGIFWGWASTGILLLVFALFGAVGGWTAMPIAEGEEERGPTEREPTASSTPQPVPVTDPASSIDPRLSELARSFTDFGFRLYQELPKKGNAFFSPLSVAMALAAILPGAKGKTRGEIEVALLRGSTEEGRGGDPTPSRIGGITVEELPEVIRGLLPQLLRCRRMDWVLDETTGQPTEKERDFFRLHLATALFAQERYPLRPAYRATLKEDFRAELYSLDFGDAGDSAARVNHWVDIKTEGKIPNLVSADSIEPDTRLVVANAVYFLSAWADKFDEDLTAPEPFHLLPGSDPDRVEVQMMRKSAYLPYWGDDALGLQALEIPYQAMSMLVLLPGEGSFEAVDSALDAKLVERIVWGMEARDVDLRLPRLKLKMNYDLTANLQAMGVETVFDQESSDLSGITDDPDGLALSKVVHQARVTVDEHGTEAAAATALMALGCSAPMEEPEVIPFIVDRPFFFAIRCERSGAALFLGRVTDPS